MSQATSIRGRLLRRYAARNAMCLGVDIKSQLLSY
jgi:hypothetical protein